MSRRRRHRRRSGSEQVELNLAAMLDMAFQLLTFFILTFRPAPVEGELALNLPPPLPMTQVDAKPAASDAPGSSAAPVKSLLITINSDSGGNVAKVKVGMRAPITGPATSDNLRLLSFQLNDVFSIEGTPFEQVVLSVGSRLHYEELMKVIDVCTRQKLPDGTKLGKISFVELPEE